MLVGYCETIEQTTWGKSLDDLLPDIVRMVCDHLDALKARKRIAAQLKRWGVEPLPDGSITIHIEMVMDKSMWENSGLRASGAKNLPSVKTSKQTMEVAYTDAA